MRIFFVKLAAVMVAAGLVLTGCPSTTDPANVAVTGVTVSPDTLKIGPNFKATLTATVTPGSATDKGVTWSSSDKDVTVSQTGAVTTVTTPTTVTETKTVFITVRTNDGGFEAKCTVTVDPNQTGVAVSEVQLSETSKTLNINGTFTLTATIVPKEAASGKTVTWTSDNTDIATVNKGKVTAVKAGSARITATVDEVESAPCTVTVSNPSNASVQDLLETGIDNLKGGYFDGALTSFEAAYNKDNQNTAAVVYSSLAKLASIVKDQSFRSLLSNRAGINGYPDSIDQLFSGDWMENYVTDYFLWSYYDAGQWVYWYDAGDYFFDYYKLPHQSGYYREDITLLSTERKTGRLDSYWDENTGEWVYWWEYNYSTGDGEAGYYYWNNYGQAVLVSTTERTGDLDGYYDAEQQQWGSWYAEKTPAGYYYWDETYSLVSTVQKHETDAHQRPGLGVPAWFSNTEAYKNSLSANGLKTPGTWELLLMANLLDKNSSGLNSLLDEVLSSVFGATFEAAATRAASIGYNASFTVSEDLLKDFGVWELFEGDVKIGRAELDLLFSSMRVLKASLEWVSAYDWNTNVNFLKTDWYGLDISSIPPASLPFRTNFMKDRNNGRMAQAKASYTTAINTAIAAYDSLITANSHLPPGAVNTLKEYGWIKAGLTQLRTAITSGGDFYVKEGSGSTYANTESGAMFGINLGKFFTPGQFAIDTLISAEGSGNTVAPKFFGMTDGQNGTPITATNPIDGYGMIGFELDPAPLKAVFVYGFDNFLPENKTILPLLPPDIAEQIYDLYH
jgi:hypothetical protein